MHISLLLWCHMTHGHQKTHVDMSWDQFCSIGLIFQSCDIVDETLVVLLHQRLSQDLQGAALVRTCIRLQNYAI